MSGGIVDSVGASATTIKNAVWNALTSAHTTVGSFGVLLKDELAKFGTLVNTGGTATLGGMIGDTANSSIVARLNAIPTTSGGGGVPSGTIIDPYISSVNVISAASANTFGAWVQLSANIGTSKFLKGTSITASNPAGTWALTECEISEGSSGSEVVIQRVTGLGNGTERVYQLLQNQALTNGSRIAVRVRNEGIYSSTVRFGIQVGAE